jgi:hypothetical protein
MMFEQYIKLFNIDWIEPWMVEALAIVAGGFVLSFIVCKALDCFNGDQR